MAGNGMTELVLNPQTALVLATGEPFGVRHAARAVARDLARVLSAEVRFGSTRPADAPLALYIDSTGELARQWNCADDLAGAEEFILRQRTEANGQHSILIAGGGERGAIYGLYHFSHTHLGVDPLWAFTGQMPQPRAQVALRDVTYTSTPAAFRYRGWHVENVQVLQDWQGHDQRAGYWEFWDRLLETLLRLRGNMVKPNWNDPSRPELALAQRLGLLITQEHCCPFGVGNWAIRSDEPGFNFNYEDHPHVFLNAWENALLRYPRPENVIWTLGFRGQGDRPFWMHEPERYDTDAKRGAVISRVLREQKALVEKHLGHTQPAFIHNTWMEGNRLVTHGHTQLPEGVMPVYADNGYGTFRSMIAEGCDPAQVAPALPAQRRGGDGGVYFHVSMWDFNTPFLTNFVPPARVQEQFAQVLDRQLTGYLLINVGRIRDCISSIAMIAQVWNQGRFAGEQFLTHWCAQRFGAAAADARACYEHLYHSPSKWGQWGQWEDYMIGDVGYVRRATVMIEELFNPGRRRHYETLPFKFWQAQPRTLAQQAEYFLRDTAAAAPQWADAAARARAAQAQLEGAARDFFILDVGSQVQVHQTWNEYLHEVARAVQRYEAGDLAGALEPAQAARACVDRVRAVLASREYAPWSGWNTPALLRFACVPMAEHWIDLLIANIRALTTERPAAF